MRHERPISKRLAKWLDTFGNRLCPIEQCPTHIYVPWRDLRYKNSKIEIRAFTWWEWKQGAISRMGRHDSKPKIMRDHDNYGKHAG